MSKSSVLVIGAAVVLLGLCPATAHAYIDPGTGSFIFQGIIAAVVGLGFAVKVFWKRIVALFTGRPAESDADDE